MPVKLINESAAVDAVDADLLTQDGELTLEAQAIANFLTHADFSSVFANPAAAPHVVEFDAQGKLAKGDKAIAERLLAGIDSLDDLLDGEAAEFMEGEQAAKLVDQDDLVEMFLHYVDTLGDTSLEEKATLAALGNLFGITEKFARGGFKKLARTKVGHAKVARMMLAMLNKGAIKRVGSGKGYGSGGYDKGTAYKKAANVKASAKQKIAKYKKANVGKQKKAARAARANMKETALSVFGFGVPVDEHFFEVASIDAVVEAPTQESAVDEGNVVVEGAATSRPGHRLVAEATGAKPAAKGGEKVVLSEGARLAAGMGRIVSARTPTKS